MTTQQQPVLPPVLPPVNEPSDTPSAAETRAALSGDETLPQLHPSAKLLTAFVSTYKIRAIEGEPSQVALTIPKDKTLADFLTEGQQLSKTLNQAEPSRYKAKQAISPLLLDSLLTDRFVQNNGTGGELITNGCNKNRQFSIQSPPEVDPFLVAMHTARYLLDATSIFQDQTVRNAKNAFIFDENDGVRGGLPTLATAVATSVNS